MQNFGETLIRTAKKVWSRKLRRKLQKWRKVIKKAKSMGIKVLQLASQREGQSVGIYKWKKIYQRNSLN